MQKKKKVIVLILSYNGKELLDDAVSSYLNNSYENFEVVVIDNGSSDGTQDYVNQKWPEVRVLRTDTNLKYSGGFNFGLKYAFEQQKADYVLITNNDVKVDQSIVAECVKIADLKENVGFVTGKVYYYDSPNILQTCGREWEEKNWRGEDIGVGEEDQGQYDTERELPWCDDIFWLVNKEVYDQVGGYNTEFAFQAEDFEWQVRAKKRGFKIYFTPHAKLWHKESVTIGKVSPFKMYFNFRNPLIVHMMHRDYKDYKYYYKEKRKYLFILSVKSLVKLKFKTLLKSWEGFLSALNWGLKNKRIKPLQIIK